MKKLLIAAVLLVGFVAGAFAQNEVLDFTLVNKTGKQIHYVFVSAHDDEDWGEDIMGTDVLMNNDKVDITFTPGGDTTIWDLKVQYSDGKTSEWTTNGFDLSRINELTLKISGGKATASWK